jgi:spermidine/putrescine transport system permease protein
MAADGPHGISRRWSLGVGGLLAAPMWLFVLLFFVIPSIILFVYSFWIGHSFQLEPDLTLANYIKALSTEIFYSVTWTGVKIGFITATISTAVSYPVAYYLVYRARGNAVLYLVLISWFMSYLVRVFAWRTILGSTGIVNSGLKTLGLIDEPLSFLIFSPFAVVITLVHIFLPFTLLLIVSALRDVKVEYLEAARDLGANGIATFFRVQLPLTLTGLVSTFMFTFVLAAGDYVTPQLVGGRQGVTTGVLVATQFKLTGNWPYGASMAFLLLALFLFIYFMIIQASKIAKLAPGSRFHDLEPAGEPVARAVAP